MVRAHPGTVIFFLPKVFFAKKKPFHDMDFFFPPDTTSLSKKKKKGQKKRRRRKKKKYFGVFLVFFLYKKDEPDVIRTRNLLIWSQTRYRCATGPATEMIGYEQNAYNTRDSQAVTHPSTNRARRCLTSVIRREPVCSTWYGRRRWREGPNRRSTYLQYPR